MPPLTDTVAPEDDLGRLQRERASLQRDVAVKDAFIAHLQELLTEAATRGQQVEAEASNARRTLEQSQQAADELQRRYTALENELSQLVSRAALAAAELKMLRPKAEALAAIESGGWWRLRGRILPLLRLARRVQGTFRSPRH